MKEYVGTYRDFETHLATSTYRGACTYRLTHTHRTILQRFSKFLS